LTRGNVSIGVKSDHPVKNTDLWFVCQKNHKNNLNQILNEILEASKKYISKKTLSALTMFGKE